MLPLPAAAPVWVATQQDLQEMTGSISTEPVLAIDTESNSLFAYRERVCLVQISTPATDYLVDPLSITDLSSLAPIFSNHTQQKIFHAAEYDVICLKRDYRFEIHNVFDTMIAARILGEPQVGLGSMLSTYFSITLDKRYQRADWAKRPIPPAMLDYARMDTHFLFALKAVVESKLKENDLWELANEDFNLVSMVNPPTIESNGKSCWKVSGSNHINPREAAILQALCAYRDQYAQKVDLPHFKVLSNDLLVEISQSAPLTKEELQQVPGMSERLFKRHADGLLNAIHAGENTPPPERQPRHHPDQSMLARLNALHEWRKEQGKKLKVESDVILPRECMEKIAAKNPRDLMDLKNLMEMIPWRYHQYGEAILRIIQPQGEK